MRRLKPCNNSGARTSAFPPISLWLSLRPPSIWFLLMSQTELFRVKLWDLHWCNFRPITMIMRLFSGNSASEPALFCWDTMISSARVCDHNPGTGPLCTDSLCLPGISSNPLDWDYTDHVSAEQATVHSSCSSPVLLLPAACIRTQYRAIVHTIVP